MSTTPISTSSSVSSSSTTKRDHNNNSCYFPGCRKDANCHCEMCLASIHATRDLMPFSSLTKLSASRPRNYNYSELTPVSFDAAALSTPTTMPARERKRATQKERLRFGENMVKRFYFFGVLIRVVVGLCLVLVAEFGFCWFVNGVLKDGVLLRGDVVRSFGERGLSLGELEEELERVVGDGGKVGNCSGVDSKWNVQQDGLLLVSRCTLYKSMTEEVSVWGWPLQTAGLLTARWSSKSFTVMSGRVTEWADGRIGYVVRNENSSWVHKKWDASAVQMDPNTWVLEYKQSSVLENPRLFSVAFEFLSYGMSRAVRRLNQKFWFSALWCQCSKIPT